MGDNPNWQPFLDKLPESMHELVKPTLIEWDKGVQDKLASIRSEYEPYKGLVDQGIEPNDIVQALQVADLIRENPKLVIDRINEAHQLGYVDKDSAESFLTPDTNTTDYDDLEENESMDIENNPKFKAMLEQINAMNTTLSAQQEAQQEEKQQAEFESYLKSLHTDSSGNPVEFDDEIVTAYMVYGDIDGPAAIEKYRQLISSHLKPPTEEELQQQQGQSQASSNGSNLPPVVLDGNPAGSGSEQKSIDFGKLSKSDTTDMVAKMLEAAALNDQ